MARKVKSFVSSAGGTVVQQYPRDDRAKIALFLSTYQRMGWETSLEFDRNSNTVTLTARQVNWSWA